LGVLVIQVVQHVVGRQRAPVADGARHEGTTRERGDTLRAPCLRRMRPRQL
jgi:hypothetical protein